MDKNNIIKSLKGQDEEKVGFSLKLPKSLKEELHSLCEKESVSMNALIVATLQSLINDECGKSLKAAKRLLINYRSDLVKDVNAMQEFGISSKEEAEACSDKEISINEINDLLGI